MTCSGLVSGRWAETTRGVKCMHATVDQNKGLLAFGLSKNIEGCCVHARRIEECAE